MFAKPRFSWQLPGSFVPADKNEIRTNGYVTATIFITVNLCSIHSMAQPFKPALFGIEGLKTFRFLRDPRTTMANKVQG